MDQDRTRWGAREYADALNSASATELLQLAQEVNEKWNAAGDPRPRVTADVEARTSNASSRP